MFTRKTFFTFLSTTIISISASQALAMGTPQNTNPGTTPAPVEADLATVTSEISAIAAKSSCSNYSWKDRGRAPAGYVKGMAMTFAKSLCRQKAGESTAKLMASKNTGDSNKDVLTWYESKFDALNLPIDSSGPDTLRSLYSLGIGLGMRESSGKYCEGYDAAVAQNSASEAEAGMFQTSYNSVGASVELKNLYNEYKNDTSKCFLDVYKAGVSCKARSIIGSGAGADFQKLAKSCPAFAAEYAMTSLRVLRKHYGPINRKEAELNNSCNQMLDQVQDYVDSKRALVCESL